MPADAKRFDDLKLHLHLLGKEHEITAEVRVGPAKLLDLLPPARVISEGITRVAIDDAAARGEAISCRAGCGACCRQLVPISPAEAVRLAEVVEAMPEERRAAVKKRFADAVKRLEERGLLDRRAPRGRAALVSAKKGAKAAWDDVSRRYFESQIPCPFLENESCGIYPERPIVCREFLVTTPAEKCATWSAGVRAVPRLARLGEVMRELSNELLGRDDRDVPLTLALEWAEAHGGALDHDGDGEELAMALVERIQAEDERGA